MSKKSKTDKVGTAKEKGAKKSELAAAAKGNGKAVSSDPVAAEDKRASVEGKSAGAGGKRGDADAKQSGAHGKRAMEERQVMLISKALADPTRLSIFRAIARGGASCASIKDGVAVSAATLSHHMKELEGAGLIDTSRKGRFLNAALHKKVWKSYLGELKSFTE